MATKKQEKHECENCNRLDLDLLAAQARIKEIEDHASEAEATAIELREHIEKLKAETGRLKSEKATATKNKDIEWVNGVVGEIISGVLTANHIPKDIKKADNIADMRVAISMLGDKMADLMASAAGSGNSVGLIRGITFRFVVSKLTVMAERLEQRLVDLELAAANKA